MLQAVTLIVMAVLVIIDQIIKLIVLKYLEPVGSYILVDKFLSLTYVENTGAAFGFFSTHTTLLSIFTVLVLIVGLIILLSGKLKPKIVYVCVLMIVSGGFGNLIDRVLRGFVVDYIEPLFMDFAVFNFADMLVSVGATLLITYLIIDMVAEVRRDETGTDDEEY